MGEDDETRFTRLYATYYTRVLAYALRRVTRDVAREGADETFLIAWRRLANVPSAPLPWLLVTVRKVLADRRRKDQRQDALTTEVARCWQQRTDPGPDDGTVERLSVLQALGELSEQDRDCLMLTVWDGLTRYEAASVLGCTTGTFTVRLHRARRRLAAALDRVDAATAPASSGDTGEGSRSSSSREHRVRPAYGQES